MGMFGARFVVFVRRACVLPGPCPATRNLSFLRFHRRRHPVVSTCCFNLLFTGLVYDGLKFLVDGNRTNTYGHVALVHPHLCRFFCAFRFSVCQMTCSCLGHLLIVWPLSTFLFHLQFQGQPFPPTTSPANSVCKIATHLQCTFQDVLHSHQHNFGSTNACANPQLHHHHRHHHRFAHIRTI